MSVEIIIVCIFASVLFGVVSYLLLKRYGKVVTALFAICTISYVILMWCVIVRPQQLHIPEESGVPEEVTAIINSNTPIEEEQLIEFSYLLFTLQHNPTYLFPQTVITVNNLLYEFEDSSSIRERFSTLDIDKSALKYIFLKSLGIEDNEFTKETLKAIHEEILVNIETYRAIEEGQEIDMDDWELSMVKTYLSNKEKELNKLEGLSVYVQEVKNEVSRQYVVLFTSETVLTGVVYTVGEQNEIMDMKMISTTK